MLSSVSQKIHRISPSFPCCTAPLDPEAAVPLSHFLLSSLLSPLAAQRYGKVWSHLTEGIPSKTLAQIKTFYQNYKIKLGLDKMDLPANASHQVRGLPGEWTVCQT